MKLKLSVVVVFLFYLLESVNAMGQANTNYYFLGYIYSRADGQALNESKVYPYLPVELKVADNPNEVLAVKVSNGNGEVSFKGVPIDVFKDYQFDVLGLEACGLKYQMDGTKEPYKFKSGNLTIHMRLPKEMAPYFTIEELVLGGSQENALLTEVLKDNVGLSYEEGSFFSEQGDLPYRLLINGRSDFNEKKFIPMLLQLSGDLIKSVKIIKYINPNPYYEGVIDIHLNQGEVTDCSMVRTDLLNYSIKQVK